MFIKLEIVNPVCSLNKEWKEPSDYQCQVGVNNFVVDEGGPEEWVAHVEHIQKADCLEYFMDLAASITEVVYENCGTHKRRWWQQTREDVTTEYLVS